jgi:ribonuclease G
VNGEIEAPILIIDRINSDLERVLKNQQRFCLTYIHLQLQKVFHHYVQNGFLNIKKGKIIPRDAYTYLEYHFYDKRKCYK